MRRADAEEDAARFFESHRAAIVIVSGGAEFSLDKTPITMGRGPGVELVFDDTNMSRQHAVLEVAGGAFRIRDLGSTNGILVNGSPALEGSLKHGDRFQLGTYLFQYVVEECEVAPPTYTVPEN
jgi:pSer/pThr/pTyr-binding forkhead associated (FHA) protein